MVLGALASEKGGWRIRAAILETAGPGLCVCCPLSRSQSHRGDEGYHCVRIRASCVSDYYTRRGRTERGKMKGKMKESEYEREYDRE